MRIASITDGYPPPAMRPLSTITKLRMDIPHDCTIARMERGLPTSRRNRTKLGHHVGPSRNVNAVVENGIAKQDDVYHC